MLAAKNERAFKALRSLFEEKMILKEYIALVEGHPKKEDIINAPLARHHKESRRLIVVEGKEDKFRGKILEAKTKYRVLKTFRSYSLLRIFLKSAVTHQIRAHLAHIGHPIVGDPLYMKRKEASTGKGSIKGQFLHASSVKFNPPFKRGFLSLKSELPLELKKFLEKLD